MQFGRIILLCIGAAIAYGIVHDQVTIRICPEYFTVAHPQVISIADPHTRDQGLLTILALIWGVIATWWVGLGLGIPLAMAARIGSWPKLTDGVLLKSVLWLLAVMGVCAAVSGLIAMFVCDGATFRYFYSWVAEQVPRNMHARMEIAGVMHNVSYAVGFFGGLILCVVTVVRRWRMSRVKSAQGPA
ncbi:MAG: hypothetical protein ACREJO_01460 [Phycisphaerales bacterium]